ncbi:MAG TPA: hypothetical protein VKV20_04555 [Ktedonobacteraceae bacterium]|jgi:hypothetical protein|nr:hypothetical protein [Ktedonobacteraceae bacterium]
MFKLIRNLLFTAIIVGGALYFFTPRLFAQVGNSVVNAINNSTVTGLAQYLPKDVNGTTNTLQLNLSGLTSRFSYFVTIDTGKCGGSPMIDLGKYLSDSSGNLNLLTTPGNLDTSHTLYIDIHRGNTDTSTSIACGQLQVNNHAITRLDLTGSSSQSNNLAPSSGQNTSQTSNNSETQSRPQAGFPNTGVAPAGSSSYDNYSFPRKY